MLASKNLRATGLECSVRPRYGEGIVNGIQAQFGLVCPGLRLLKQHDILSLWMQREFVYDKKFQVTKPSMPERVATARAFSFA